MKRLSDVNTCTSLTPLVVVLLGVIGITGCAIAQDKVETKSKMEMRALQSVLTAHSLKLGIASPENTQAFCSQFISDLMAGNRIKVVEPIVETDDPKHPQLAKYESCTKHDFIADEKSRGGPSSSAFYGLSTDANLRTIGDMDFKLYSIRDKAAGDIKELLFSAWSRELRLREELHGGYFLIDTNKCEVEGSVSPEFEPLSKKVKSNYLERENLVLRYQSDYFILNIWDSYEEARRRAEEPPNYWMTLWKYTPENVAQKFTVMCGWNETLQAK
jgi:hypothetical protein